MLIMQQIAGFLGGSLFDKPKNNKKQNSYYSSNYAPQSLDTTPGCFKRLLAFLGAILAIAFTFPGFIVLLYWGNLAYFKIMSTKVFYPDWLPYRNFFTSVEHGTSTILVSALAIVFLIVALKDTKRCFRIVFK